VGNLKGNNLRIGLLAILAVAVFGITLVHAQHYLVGVKAGDWIEYGYTVTWTGNGSEPSYVTDAKKLEWVRVDVLSLAGTTATINETLHYTNSSQTSQSYDINVQSSKVTGYEFLVASNLTAGDPLSPQTPDYTINQTATGLYAGAKRNVNILDTKSSKQGSQSEIKIYWDQNTGIMVELYENQTDNTNPGANVETSIKATETNLWSANALDLFKNNQIYIVASIIILIIIVAATIALLRRKNPFLRTRRRKKPSHEHPPPSTH
jgi:hypothetical protein